MSNNVTHRIARRLDLPFGEPRLLARGCGSSEKMAYADEASAARALVLMQVRRQVQANMGKPHADVESRYYRCNTCPGWHLTSKPFRPARGRTA